MLVHNQQTTAGARVREVRLLADLLAAAMGFDAAARAGTASGPYLRARRRLARAESRWRRARAKGR